MKKFYAKAADSDLKNKAAKCQKDDKIWDFPFWRQIYLHLCQTHIKLAGDLAYLGTFSQ